MHPSRSGATRARRLSRLVQLTSLVVVAGLFTTLPAAQAAVPSSAKPVPVTIQRVAATTAPTSNDIAITASVVVVNPSAARRPADQLRVKLIGKGNLFNLGVVRVPAIAKGGRVTVKLTKSPPAVTPPGTYAVRACPIMRAAGPCRTSAATVRIAPAALVASPKTLAFGEQPVGTSTTKRVTITNKGRAGSGRVTTKLGAGAFDIDATTCSAALLPGKSCTVDVSFSPSSPGEDSNTLTVTPGRGSAATVDVTGTGIGAAALELDRDDIEFDDTLVGATSDPEVVTVTNVGVVPTGVPSVDTSGTFAVAGTTCTAPLAPGASCTVNVTFEPTENGPAAGALAVTATPGGTATADLSGTGLAPASLSVSPPSAAFGSEIVGDTTDPVTFTLTNTGDVASGTPTVALGGIDADQFTIVDNGCTAAVAAGDTCDVDVAFAPTATGSASASLDVSATPGGTDTSTLTGTGETEPTLSISETSYDFGFTGDPTEHTFTVTNTGTTGSGAPTADVTGDEAFEVTSDTCTAPLPGGGTCTVGVTYTGSGQDEQTAQLSVSATPGGTVTADLTGSPQALTVEPTSHDYGGVLVGDTSAAVSYTLTNHRNTAVQVDGETIVGPFPLDSSCFPVVIPAGGTCTFSAHFAPNNPGPASGYVEYSAQGGTAHLDLSGEGLTPASFSLNPSTVDFGAYQPGDIGTQLVTITNTGTQASSNISFSITGPDAIEFYTDSTDCPTTLAGGASCTATVGFAPITLGDKTATFTVAGASGGTAGLIGLGAPAGVTLYPASYDYGAVAVGGAAYFTFRVVNTTNNGEDMNSASSGPPFPLELNQDFTCVLVISTIQPHRWCTMTLSFKPQSVGSFSTTLTAGGTNFNTQSQLSGTGVPARPGAPLPGAAAGTKATKNWVLAIKNGKPVISKV